MAGEDDETPMVPTTGRQLSRTPYRGPRRVRRSDGQAEVWVEGQGYVPEQSARRLTGPEQGALQAARDAGLQAGRYLPDLNRFEQLNRVQDTGNIVQRVGTFLGIPPLLPDKEEEEMYAITERLTPRQREPGSGASSDRDVTMFRAALPNLARSGPANSNVIQQARARVGELQDYPSYLEWYGTQHGTLNGAQESWNAYINRGTNRPPWRQFFGAQPAPQQQQQAPQQQRRLRYNPNSGEIE